MQPPGQIGDARRVPNGAANKRKDVVIAKRAFHALIVIAEHGDKERLHAGDQEGPAAQENSAPHAVGGVEKSVADAKDQDRVEDRTMRAGIAEIEVDEQIAKENA